jgi:hypothetical protein
VKVSICRSDFPIGLLHRTSLPFRAISPRTSLHCHFYHFHPLGTKFHLFSEEPGRSLLEASTLSYCSHHMIRATRLPHALYSPHHLLSLDDASAITHSAERSSPPLIITHVAHELTTKHVLPVVPHFAFTSVCYLAIELATKLALFTDCVSQRLPRLLNSCCNCL